MQAEFDWEVADEPSLSPAEIGRSSAHHESNGVKKAGTNGKGPSKPLNQSCPFSQEWIPRSPTCSPETMKLVVINVRHRPGAQDQLRNVPL